MQISRLWSVPLLTSYDNKETFVNILGSQLILFNFISIQRFRSENCARKRLAMFCSRFDFSVTKSAENQAGWQMGVVRK